MSEGDKKKNWFQRHKVLSVILGLILLFIIIGATGSDNKTPTKQTQTTTIKSTTPKPDTSAAKKIADGIKIESTGFNYSSDKSQITYGFILDNSQKFTGIVGISLSGVNGSLSDATTFTENNLAAGAGDIGTVSLSGRYTEYSYKVTVDGQTFSYAGGQIPVNE